MPRQRTDYHIRTYDVPQDFPERLVRFREQSGLSWSGIARRLGADSYTVRRWVLGRARRSMRYMMALLDLAEGLGLGYLFTK